MRMMMMMVVSVFDATMSTAHHALIIGADGCIFVVAVRPRLQLGRRRRRRRSTSGGGALRSPRRRRCRGHRHRRRRLYGRLIGARRNVAANGLELVACGLAADVLTRALGDYTRAAARTVAVSRRRQQRPTRRCGRRGGGERMLMMALLVTLVSLMSFALRVVRLRVCAADAR